MEPKTRVCKYCGTRCPIEKFELANVIKGKEYRRWKCQKCYQETKNVRRRKIAAWLKDYKKELSCQKCGEDDFRVLDFHHIRDKDREISNSIQVGWSKKRILEEMKKCEVLCCKCHRILHWEEKYGV